MRKLAHVRVVYDGILELGEHLAQGYVIANVYDILSMTIEHGPGSHITVHFLYWQEVEYPELSGREDRESWKGYV